MEEVIMTRPIRAELISLKIGGKATFPIERYASVFSAASKMKIEMMRKGWNYKISRNSENFTVTVERIA